MNHPALKLRFTHSSIHCPNNCTVISCGRTSQHNYREPTIDSAALERVKLTTHAPTPQPASGFRPESTQWPRFSPPPSRQAATDRENSNALAS